MGKTENENCQVNHKYFKIVFKYSTWLKVLTLHFVPPQIYLGSVISLRGRCHTATVSLCFFMLFHVCVTVAPFVLWVFVCVVPPPS